MASSYSAPGSSPHDLHVVTPQLRDVLPHISEMVSGEEVGRERSQRVRRAPVYLKDYVM